MPLVDRAHRDELLRKHVERVPRVARLLDQAFAHPLRDDRGLQQVAAELREDLAAAGLADLVARAPDPLQAARDRARRLDLDHEVDGAHVDAELERRRGDDRPQAPRLQRVLDLGPLLARERAVVRADEVLVGELVEPGGEALGQAARVHEHDRGTVRADQLEQLRVDRGPDRRRRRRATGRRRPQDVGHRARSLDGAPELGHVLDRDDDLDLERLAVPGVDDRDGAGSRSAVWPAEEPRDLVERALRGRQADALRRRVGAARSSRSSESARCAPRLVAASAWISSTITQRTLRSVSRACDVSIR